MTASVANTGGPTIEPGSDGDIFGDLKRRGLVFQSTDEQSLSAHFAGGARTVYCGFDPTAPSLHVGNLVPLLVLRRLQLAGHRPIVLVGGATGLIGDPSFKDSERPLHDTATVEGWVERIRSQAAAFVEFGGPSGALVVNNLDWTRSVSVVDFLRDVGKHFSVNAMIKKEAVKNRLEREDVGISYTEFSYLLLQSFDFLELARRHDCSVQVGGSDQWSNILGGVDLVRRELGRDAHAITVPLVTTASGVKFGKSEGNAIWLDPALTSPYAFYQFWLNTADADVEAFLGLFTFLSAAERAELTRATREAPQERSGQKALAASVTGLVHGDAGLSAAQRITEALFSNALAQLTAADLASLAASGMDHTTVTGTELSLIDALAQSGLADSKGAARRLLKNRGVSVNGEVAEGEPVLARSGGLHGGYHLLRRGKKQWHLLVWG